MTSVIKWLVFGVCFGVGVKGGMALYDYARSDKAKEHFSNINKRITDYFNDVVDPKPQ